VTSAPRPFRSARGRSRPVASFDTAAPPRAELLLGGPLLRLLGLTVAASEEKHKTFEAE
jgi:hypothetical protein